MRVSKLSGLAGTARLVTGENERKDQEATLAAWLIEAPGQSAAWRHYLLSVIHLREIEGAKPAQKNYPEAEYEIMMAALDPKLSPNPEALATLQPLYPINLCEQFDGISDQEAVDLCEQFASAVVDGILPGEFDKDGPWGDQWRQSLARTLEHIKTGGHRFIEQR